MDNIRFVPMAECFGFTTIDPDVGGDRLFPAPSPDCMECVRLSQPHAFFFCSAPVVDEGFGAFLGFTREP
jgi:hypothetical protein